MQFINATLYLQDRVVPKGFVIVENGIITAAGDMQDQTFDKSAVDLSGYILAPGFIDQHVHGAGGADVMDASPEALDTIARHLAQEGTTSFLATTLTMSTAKIHQALQAVADYKKNPPKNQGAEILGVHLEGPFINTAYKGAQNEQYIVAPDKQLFESFQKSAGNSIKLISYAIEKDPEQIFLGHLRQAGVVASCGHSGATFEDVERCTPLGLKSLTHFHNAMSGHHHRNPGAVTAGFCLPALMTEVIADGLHLHPAVLRMVYQIKGKDSVILITDAVRAKGLPDGNYELSRQQIIKTDNACRLVSGTLAGSVLTMDHAVRNMVKYSGCSLYEAVQMASLNPARLLGIDDQKGSIAPNKDADLVVLSQDGDLQMTIAGGQMIKYRRSLATSIGK
ncbi:N-acetylglucosamine-6-phosphate deacetylase [Desulfosporosinus sp. SB140]|uniref:N-acetylglucosamine-6-phosphate deacetylase n=1 Tax=Desulfosporosinus paludis TaxID=3115649 RepID=UPI00388ED844